jgi:hypothetical protein
MPRSTAFPLPQPLFDEPTFSEGKPTPDPTRFAVPHPTDTQLYTKIQELLYDDVVGFPISRSPPGGVYSLESAWGPHGAEIVAGAQSAGHVVFHMVGDIGASTAAKYPGEIRVSDAISNDCQSSPATDRPAFLYILGDVVYDFGEAQYYFDQFYDPYRNYPAPIFAIPGNHDSFIVPGTASSAAPLVTFQRNFCATEPVVTPEAGSLHRTAMTEPGVYFALDAPFVRILGLFSNALEDPGVISSEDGKWMAIPDYQLDFLTAQLSRIKSENYTGAVILATHHPPFNYAPPAGGSGAGGIHGGSPDMLAQIDDICRAQGVYPHAFLSGHAHNYQRYTRTVSLAGSPYEVPFIVCGDGGHGVDRLVQAKLGSIAEEPANGADVSYLDANPAVTASGLVLERHDDRDYGYLRVSVNSSTLTFGFYQVGAGAAPSQPADSVSIDLPSHTIVPSTGSTGSAAARRFQKRQGSNVRKGSSRAAGRPRTRRGD